MKRWAGVLLMVLAVCWTPASAELAVDGHDWNDLSQWAASLRAQGAVVDAVDTLDLSTLAQHDGLALIDPPPLGEAAGLRRFVQEGGRLLIAVEGPRDDDLMRRFEMRVTAAPADAERLGGHPALLIAWAEAAGLFDGVRAVVTNHPGAFSAHPRLKPLARIGQAPFAYQLGLGTGEVLLLADSSLFINGMLQAGDNARLGLNIGDWLSRGGSGPVRIVGPSSRLIGAYGARPVPVDGVRSLNRALAQIGDHPEPSPWIVYTLLGLLLAAGAIYAVAVFPGAEPSDSGPSAPSRAPEMVERLAGMPGGPAAPDVPRKENPPA